MCSKRGFTKKEAQSALNHAQHKTHRQYRKECRIYACPDCGHWHLTSKELWDESPQEDLKFKDTWKQLLNATREYI